MNLIKGVAYYPEHWDQDLWQEDFDNMKAMGVNTIRIAEFMWSLIEPSEGAFDFTLLDEMVNQISKNDFNILIGIPTATFPQWIINQYDNILAQDQQGNTRKYGTRRQYCYNSAKYLELSKKMTKKIVKRYADHKHVIAWQVDNELGHEGSDFCTCDNCKQGFQQFLKEKYQTIDQLNEVYGNVFWGQIYESFETINIPFGDLLKHNPTFRLDYARFMSQSIKQFNETLVSVVNQHKNSSQQVTTNLPGGLFDKWFDPNQLAQAIDFVSFDNYPVWGGQLSPPDEARVAMELDMIRGLKQQNFWIVEELIGGQGHDLVGWLPRPNQAKLWAMQANLRGAEALFFFRYRGFNKGEEQFCQGIFDVDNEKNYKFDEVQQFFKDLDDGDSVKKYDHQSKVALVYDYDNIWSWKIQPQSPDYDFAKEALALYRPTFDLGINCDVISTAKDFDQYDVLLLPTMQIMDETLVKQLKNFAEQGKTIVFSYRAGIRDRDNNLHFGKRAIEAMTGVKVYGYEALNPTMDYQITNNDETYEIGIWRDILTTTTAKGLYYYTDYGYQDNPCITKNNYLNGEVYYIGSSIEPSLLREIYIGICEKNNIQYYQKDRAIEMIHLMNDQQTDRFILNHMNEQKVVEKTSVEAYDYLKMK